MENIEEQIEEQDNGFVDLADDDVTHVAAVEEEKTTGDSELAFEEQVVALETAVARHPLNREVLYSILSFCQQERSLRAVEQAAEALPIFKGATQNPYHMVCTLERFGGLVRIERDADGEEVTPVRKEGLSEDEVDDLVCDLCFATTDVGARVVELHDPAGRIRRLFERENERATAFEDVLAFVGEAPRSYPEIQALLRGRPELSVVIDGTPETMQPSVFVDKLERAGALVWKEKWELTEEGRKFLEGLKEE